MNGKYTGHTRLERGQIRLVQISSDPINPDQNSPQSLVQCHLKEVTMEESIGKYTALSYCWGAFNPGKKILLDGREYIVTENLHCALEIFRQMKDDRWLFIDALCINQNNNVEKSSQVQNMWAIYENAKQVVVFLGEKIGIVDESTGTPVETTKEVFDWIKLAAGQLSSRHIRFPALKDQRLIHEGLRAMLSFGWWSRVWVIQEISVAKQPLVRCGLHDLAWHDLDSIIKFYLEAVLEPPNHDHIFSWMPPFTATRLPSPGVHDPSLKEAIAWDAACAIRTARSRVQKKERDHGLASLLIRFRDFASSEPVDRIYGLFRLSQESAGIQPDYSKPVEEVYMKAVENSISKSSQGLALFSMLNYEHINVSQLDLPTWCPDFSGPAPRGDPYYRPEYDSAKGFNFEPSAQGRVLTLVGINIGTIKQVFTTDDVNNMKLEEDDDAISTIRTLDISASDILWFHKQQILLISPANELDDPFEDCTWDSTRVYIENYLQKILRERKTVREYLEASTAPPQLFGALCVKAGRQLFISEEGHFGHAPLCAKEGDSLVVLSHGKVPFCIRKYNDIPQYHLIGDCYIHGFMAGEAIPTSTKEIETKKKYFEII